MRWQWLTTRCRAPSQASEYSPRQPWVIRPWRSTWVASNTRSEAPEFASMPKWVMCQSSATPSLALYWHIGETAMRLASSRSASFIGENSALVMIAHMLAGSSQKYDRSCGKTTPAACSGATFPNSEEALRHLDPANAYIRSPHAREDRM